MNCATIQVSKKGVAMGFGIVVPTNHRGGQDDYKEKKNDVEANLIPTPPVYDGSAFFAEEPECSCFPSCDEIVATVYFYCDSVTEVFCDIIYGESDTREKEP